MSENRRIALRFLAASATGLAVFVIACLAAWLSCRNTGPFGIERAKTRIGIWQIGKEIESYRRTKGFLPENLSKLREHADLHESALVDGWNRPFQYNVDGDKYLIASNGRDGRPGGKGLDADSSNETHGNLNRSATLSQFLFDMPTGGVVAVCAAAGLLAFGLSLWLIRISAPSATTVNTIVARVAITSVATVVAAVVVSAVHFTLGH